MDQSDSPTDPDFNPTVRQTSDEESAGGDGLKRELPSRLGRYTIEGLLGEGGFARVLLAYDCELERRVALKVPRAERFGSSSTLRTFLDEARMAARLRHPGIVTVHDVGQCESIPYIVMEYIRGRTLSRFLSKEPVSYVQATRMMRQTADALFHAHSEGFVHRDLKPQNILLDNDDRPHIADFGLALRHRGAADYSTRLIGTPEYMAPEQAAGENHRIDLRTDIWAVGVIYYQMLCGEMPFRGGPLASLLETILSGECVPPSQVDTRIPAELDRICMRCLSRRMSERYRSASELVSDFDRWLQTSVQASGSGSRSSWDQFASNPSLSPVPIVPRGLRSFGPRDADFFTRLLPGPRDREGLPRTLRFWKHAIEQRDPEQTFRVGLLYGPSGCGKSSLVRAGLIPRLGDVSAIYIEATAPNLEKRLNRAVARRLRFDRPHEDLAAALHQLREGEREREVGKIVIVIDQFEQWLCRNQPTPTSELVQALRQCDGGKLQCVLLVRDDFWLAVSRFMNLLEIPIVDGENAELLDSFTADHGREVLIELGIAHGCLPEQRSDFTNAQRAFVDRAIEELSSDGRLFPVRLTVFAEMVRGEPWQLSTLDALGGVDGIGVAFLDRAVGRKASAVRRVHTEAARKVLATLLPTRGLINEVTVKRVELLRVSGYADEPRDFEQLMHLLDNELRLLTPLSAESDSRQSWDSDSASEVNANQPRYKLTHDFLVTSIREWLERDLSSTPGGRLRLMLHDQAELWSSRSSSRFLPSFSEWVQYKLRTPSESWNPHEREMLASAGRRLRRRAAVTGLVVAIFLFVGSLANRGLERRRRADRAEYMLSALQEIDIQDVPNLIDDLEPIHEIVLPRAESIFQDPANPQDVRVRAAMVTLRSGDQAVPAMVRWVTGEQLPADEFLIAVSALEAHREAAGAELLQVLNDEQADATVRLRAISALARLDASRLDQLGLADEIVRTLLQQPATDAAVWIEALDPAAALLMDPLRHQTGRCETLEAARIGLRALTSYAEDPVDAAMELLPSADPNRFRAILECLRKSPVASRDRIEGLLADKPAEDPADDQTWARRRVNAVLAAFALGDLQPIIESTRRVPTNRLLRLQLIAEMTPARIDFQRLCSAIYEHADQPQLSATLMLAAGTFTDVPIGELQRKKWLSFLKDQYVTSDSREVHAASGLLLRRWGVDTEGIDRRLAALGRDQDRRWFVDPYGQTMMIIRPHDQPEISGAAGLRYSFAIAATECPIELYRRFDPDFVPEPGLRTSNSQTPVTQVLKSRIGMFCNWLSEEAGVERQHWCYATDAALPLIDCFPDPEYRQRSGYRLPSVEEWQVICAAGFESPWLEGLAPQDAQQYLWDRQLASNRLQRIAQRLPNPFGLFDLYGNASEICFTLGMDSEITPVFESRGGSVVTAVERILSGEIVRSSNPQIRESYGGFRLVRTVLD